VKDFVTKDSGQRAKFDTGAQRDTAVGKGRYDLLPVNALRRVAQLYERGAVKYVARNWEKGIPVARMLDSALRHTLQYLGGMRDEDHLAGAVFNLLGVIEYEERVLKGLLPSTLFDDLGPLNEAAVKELFESIGKGQVVGEQLEIEGGTSMLTEKK